MEYSVEDAIEQDMNSLDKFMPPEGRLLLALIGEAPAGLACLKKLEEGVGEIKRMYVRPEFRGQGIGGALLEKLTDEAVQIGYTALRLDSARFMKEAHKLYRSMGFTEIESYEGSEIPEEFRSFWIFMEKRLANPEVLPVKRNPQPEKMAGGSRYK